MEVRLGRDRVADKPLKPRRDLVGILEYFREESLPAWALHFGVVRDGRLHGDPVVGSTIAELAGSQVDDAVRDTEQTRRLIPSAAGVGERVSRPRESEHRLDPCTRLGVDRVL